MSGFLPDLANWALRGGAGDNNNNDETSDDAAAANNNNNNSPQVPNLSAAEMRERRLARLAKMEAAQQQQQQPESSNDPMQVDHHQEEAASTSTTTPMDISNSPPRKKLSTSLSKASSSSSSTNTTSNSTTPTKKKKTKETKVMSPQDSALKLRRKKELLIKKVLNVTFERNSSDSGSVFMELDTREGEEIGVHTIAELLANRLSLAPEDMQTVPQQKPLILYLAQAHRKAGEELKAIRQSSSNKSKMDTSELQEILQEIQRQVVNYSASSLMEPDLFEQAKDGTAQLTKALIHSTLDPISSITFGVSGNNTSFYYLMCEELYSQDKAAFGQVIQTVANQIVLQLRKCDSIDSGVGESTALALVSALTSLCSHKKAALSLTLMEQFLVPSADSPAASEQIRPPLPSGPDLLRMLAGENRPYAKRSGPGVEKLTVLGACLRISSPKNNPAFSPTSILRQSLDSVERSTNTQRRALKLYQDNFNQFIMALIKAGAEARGKVLQWFTDCLLLNTGATAMRPDPTKVASSAMLLNVSVALLKLCEPFVNDETKHHLIHPGFVSSTKDNGGIFPTSGDDFLPRLGESDGDSMVTSDYAPKNSFIPQCFFLAARSLALGIVPMLSHHENLLRHISHQHYELSSNNRDLQSDPHFCILVSKQRSGEIALFQEEMVQSSLDLFNLMAKMLGQMEDDQLKTMPEHFVDNICDALMSVAKMKPKLLRGLNLKNVFQVVVKLLSSKYASMVRNYNLRAMLGDVLHEIFLPSGSDDKRDVPIGVACDPMAGGQTFLLSDKFAQETLAPSLLLLYGEVEHTGYYDKMSHRAKISSLLKYLWESSEHRPAFRSITQNKESFIKFANGIINETNTLIATVMQKLPEIRTAQEQMSNAQEWGRMTEEQQNIITSRLDDNEREVRHALPLCNKTLQMFGFLNTDRDIRGLFLLGELCPRLVNMLIHVLGKLVGSKGLDLKVNNPEQYEFRPKEMLRDLCAIFALFAASEEFQVECAKNGCDPNLLRKAISTCQRLNLLTGESIAAFETLPDLVEKASRAVAEHEALLADAPDEFLDEIMSTFMVDPVILPSGHFVDRATITQHLLNDPIDPFNREEMTIEDVKPATELKAKIDHWLEEKRVARDNGAASSAS